MSQKRRLQPKFFVHHCLHTEVCLLSFSKREFHLAACAFEKTASFRTQLSTYSRRLITSVEHENSGEHEISDLSTDFSLSLSTVYNLGPWARGYKPYSTQLSTVSCSILAFTLCSNSGEVIKHLEHEIVLSVEHKMLKPRVCSGPCSTPCSSINKNGSSRINVLKSLKVRLFREDTLSDLSVQAAYFRVNKIAIQNNKFQMASGQGSHWLIESPTILSSMCSPLLSYICQFYF